MNSMTARVEETQPIWIVRAVPLLFFFLVLTLPTSYKLPKAALLAICLGFVVLNVVRSRRIDLHYSVLLWTLFMSIVGLVFVLRGAASGAPGAYPVMTVYVLWPVVYAMLIAGMSNVAWLDRIIRIMVIASLFIGLYALDFILYAAGVLPAWLYWPLDLGQAIGFYSGFVEFNLYSISTLFFLVPFLIALLWSTPANAKPPVSRKLVWLALAVTSFAGLLSGRRALWLAIGLCPVFILAFSLCMDGARRDFMLRRTAVVSALAVLMLVIILFSLGAMFEIRLGSLFDYFLTAFDFERSSSASLRQLQFEKMIEQTQSSPLLGGGHGSVVAGIIRSQESPWAYELSYGALLFQTGMLGFACYFAAVTWVVFHGVWIVRHAGATAAPLFSVLVGMMAFLVGNASNPYLAKFEYLWVIFLPVAFINVWLLGRWPNRSISGGS